MFGRKCSSPGYGFVSGILFYFYFFWQPWARTFTVGKHLALRHASNMGKFSRNTVGKPGPLRRGKRKHLWWRRVETGTYHWEGRKPFIQTFELCFYGSMFALWFHCMLYFCKKKLVNYDFISCFNDLFYAVFFGLFHIFCYSLWYLIFFACVL